MPWRLSPQLKVLQGQNLANKSAYVETSTGFKDLVLYEGPDAIGGIAVSVAGFVRRGGSEASPIIDWALHAGTGPLIDDEPVASGSTFLSAGNMERQGLLFEVRGRDSTTWVLRGKCRLIALPYELGFAVTISPLPAGSTGRLEIEAGTVIG
jgi:hypothetical protein